MDKTSREYAEKLAKANLDDRYYDKESVGYRNGVSDQVKGYLTAIEETNVKQKDEVIKGLQEALEWAQNEIKILQKQIPLSNSYNLSTEEGKEAWKKHSDGMIKIENELKKSKEI